MKNNLLHRLFAVTCLTWLAFAAAELWRPGLVSGVIDLRLPLVVLLFVAVYLTIRAQSTMTDRHPQLKNEDPDNETVKL